MSPFLWHGSPASPLLTASQLATDLDVTTTPVVVKVAGAEEVALPRKRVETLGLHELEEPEVRASLLVYAWSSPHTTIVKSAHCSS